MRKLLFSLQRRERYLVIYTYKTLEWNTKCSILGRSFPSNVTTSLAVADNPTGQMVSSRELKLSRQKASAMESRQCNYLSRQNRLDWVQL